MTMKKRMVSWALSLMLVFTMMPPLSAAVYADDGDSFPAISIGAGNIEKGNKVYMGLMFVSENPDPISWLVLGDANSDDLESDGASVNAANARLLITEKTQDVDTFGRDTASNAWQGSYLQSWCTEFFLNGSDWNGERYQDYFSKIEKETMLYTSKEDGEYDFQNFKYGTSSLNNEQVFHLSAEEVSNDYGYFSGDDSRIAYPYNNENACHWWLRSPCSDDSSHVAVVSRDGYVEYADIRDCYNTRPAFNIDLNSILFTSAAIGGKISGASGADALTAVSTNPTNEWKLTLHDSSRDGFTANAATGATLSQDEGYTSWSIPIVFSGASDANDNDYISVILADSIGKALYYGQIAKKTAASSDAGQEVSIPTGLTAGDYKLYVFSEQVNGDKSSDYASSFRTIDLRVNSYSPGSGVPQANPLKIKGKTATVKYSKLKKESQTLKASKVIKTIKKGQGDLSYRYISAKKGSKSFKKYFRINKKTGEITVKKGLKKGTYKVTVKVRAAGNASYQASRWKKVTFKVRVR